jgi:hypothetical protein
MNPDVALCRHLASPALAALRIEPDDVIEWDGGPVLAVARCAVCGGAALLELLDWSATRRVRVFASSGIDPEAIALFVRNRERGSCDLQRQARETEALLFSAGPVERILALDVETRAVLASAARSAAVPVPSVPWRERIPAASDATWFARVGLDKASAS